MTGRARTLLESIPAERPGRTGSPGRSPWTTRPGTTPGRRLLVAAEKDLWLYEPGAKAARRLTNDEAEEECPASPPTARRSPS